MFDEVEQQIIIESKNVITIAKNKIYCTRIYYW